MSNPLRPERRKHENPQDRREEQGSAMLFVVVGLSALIAITAWATETGRMWQAKSQLQSVADVAALAGVGNLLSPDFQTVDEAAARTAAVSYGPLHDVLGVGLNIDGADIETGSWDLTTRTFTALPGETDADLVRAVRAVTRRDGTFNGPVPTILGAAIGVDSVNVNSEAVAYWGFAGGGGPGVADLPIALDCCAISGTACEQNYCDTISTTTPNPCPLSSGSTAPLTIGGTATCLEFHSQPEQNACWTVFDGDSSSVSTPNLLDTVENGNATDIDGPIYLDNGDKTPVIAEIFDRFNGTGGYDPAEGSDTDSNGQMDSWVVTLPVVECQNPGAGCATGSPQTVVGFVCFDIHEVIVTPDKIIKGDYVCPTDPRCDTTGLAPGGIIPGAISAQFPVIVD